MTSTKPLALSIKILISDPAGRVLLLKRSMKSKGNPGKWDFPGGKIDPGEDFEEAIRREVAEETGLIITIDGAAGTAQSESPTRRIIYLILKGHVESGEFRLSEEHEDYTWVTPENLRNKDLAPQFKQFAADYNKSPVRK